MITFLSTTFAAGAVPASIPADQLDFVDDISAGVGPNGSLQFIISLPERAEYTTSVSRVPSTFTLGIG